MTSRDGSSTGFLCHNALGHPWGLHSLTSWSSHSLHKLTLPVSYIRSGKEHQSSVPSLSLRRPSPGHFTFP